MSSSIDKITLEQSAKPRNPVSQSPLMKKGGVHQKTATAKRQQVKQNVLDELEDWREAVEFEESVKHDTA